MALTIAKALSWNLWGKTEKNHRKLQPGESIIQSRFQIPTTQANSFTTKKTHQI
jgi:hypothetical protein